MIDTIDPLLGINLLGNSIPVKKGNITSKIFSKNIQASSLHWEENTNDKIMKNRVKVSSFLNIPGKIIYYSNIVFIIFFKFVELYIINVETEDKFELNAFMDEDIFKNFTDKLYLNANKAEEQPKSNLENNLNEVLSNTTQTPEKVLFLSYPDSNVLDDLINFFKKVDQIYKNVICRMCFNHKEFLSDLDIKISIAIEELKKILEKQMKKSELIEYFSDKINKVNLIKINLDNLSSAIKLQKEFKCPDFEQINEYYESGIKATNGLIEEIQNSIRKHNLNISFLVIS